jgi:uncharacterized protein with FMN-binding domain
VPTVVLSMAALAAAWQAGSRPDDRSTLPGVVVASPAPTATHSSATGPTSTTKKKGSTAKSSVAAVRRVKGAVVSTPYGDVQVVAVLRGTRLTDVLPAHLTDANQHSRDISAGAAPTLRREALAAQSAHIDMVSGATYTSEGYRASLQAALDAAGA